MTSIPLLLSAALLAGSLGAADPAVGEAAARFAGGVVWQASSALNADFSCTGTRQDALLGRRDGEIVVAMFTHGLGKTPELLRFAGSERKSGAAKIAVEDLTLSVDEVTTLAGAPAPGYRPSASCKGVRLSDDASDAAHIYWDHQARRFETWAQQAGPAAGVTLGR